jgi:hypothetical protein
MNRGGVLGPPSAASFMLDKRGDEDVGRCRTQQSRTGLGHERQAEEVLPAVRDASQQVG